VKPAAAGRLLLAARSVAGFGFVAIFLVFVAAVAMRYLFREPIQWADEFVTVAAMWVIFWSAAFVLRDREHVAIDAVHDALPQQGRRIGRIVAALVLGGLFAAALPPVLDYVLFLWRQRTNILEWRLDIVFLCFPLFLAAAVARAAWEVVRLLGPGWRAHVARAGESQAR
jgi:TRAP-type C4-dicarboxylate transport system permease small subunit